MAGCKAPKGKAPAGPALPSVAISRIVVEDGVVDLFNYAVAQSPLKIRLEKIEATIRNVAVPSLKGKSQFDLDAVVKVLKEEQARTGIKLLWGTACLFANPRYMMGAATSCNADAFAYAAAQVKKALEVTH